MKSKIMQDGNDIMSVDAMMDERYGKVETPSFTSIEIIPVEMKGC